MIYDIICLIVHIVMCTMNMNIVQETAYLQIDCISMYICAIHIDNMDEYMYIFCMNCQTWYNDSASRLQNKTDFGSGILPGIQLADLRTLPD